MVTILHCPCVHGLQSCMLVICKVRCLLWHVEFRTQSTNDNWQQLVKFVSSIANGFAVINSRQRRSNFTRWQFAINSLAINYNAICHL